MRSAAEVSFHVCIALAHSLTGGLAQTPALGEGTRSRPDGRRLIVQEAFTLALVTQAPRSRRSVSADPPGARASVAPRPCSGRPLPGLYRPSAAGGSASIACAATPA